jgi:hypothetical protein
MCSAVRPIDLKATGYDRSLSVITRAEGHELISRRKLLRLICSRGLIVEELTGVRDKIPENEPFVPLLMSQGYERRRFSSPRRIVPNSPWH